MKKILLAILMLVGLSTFAQTPAIIVSQGTDSVLATGVIYRTFELATSPKLLSSQVVVTKIGSTTIAGTIQLQGSNDGTNYFNVNSAYGLVSDTVNSIAFVTNTATQSFTFTQKNTFYRYYRFACTGIGSGSWRPKVFTRVSY